MPPLWSAETLVPPTLMESSAMDQPSAHLIVRRSDDIAVVEFADRKILEELSIQEIEDELQRIVQSEPNIKLLLNFKNVDHLSSAALGMLIKVNRSVTEHNGRMKLSDINKQIFEVFRITRLNKILEIYPTAEDAKAAFYA